MQRLRAFLRARRRRTVRSVAGALAALALTGGIAAGALAVDATPAGLATSPAATPPALTGCRPTAPALPWPVLRTGSRGADVTALQHMLRGWSDINRFSLAADGSYGPRVGRWTLSQHGTATTAQYTWDVRTNKRWMNLLAPLARPLFEWNHDGVMRDAGHGLARFLGVRLISIQVGSRHSSNSPA